MTRRPRPEIFPSNPWAGDAADPVEASDSVEIGLIPTTGASLINAIGDGRSPETAPLMIDVLLDLRQRGKDLCDGDPNSENRKAVELWSTADYLLTILQEYVPAEEEFLREELARGVTERGAAQIAADVRWRYPLVIAYALEVAFLAAACGLEPHFRTLILGHKAIERGRAGHETVHGTKAEKEERWAKLQAAVDDLRKRNPALSKAAIRELVSKKTGVSISTLRRRTTDPGPQ